MSLGSLSASAQTRTASQADRERRAEASRAQRLRAQAEAARREVSQLDTRLAEAGRRRAEAESAAAAAEARLALLRGQIVTDTAERAQAQHAFESALIAAAFAQRRAEPRAVRAGIAARALAPGFAARERGAAHALAEAHDLELAIVEGQRILAEAASAIDAERADLVALTARRRAAQAQLAGDAVAAERRARALAAEARSLRELAQRAAANARARPGGGSAGPSVIPAAWVVPAEGSITRGFGARDGAGAPSQGVILRTRAGAQVVSPAAGEVTYAGVFRSYGQVLILNLDGGYALVLTGLHTIRTRVGETVRAGQPVGEMTASDTPAPELYVEVRRDGRAVDPGRWLNGRGTTAGPNVRAG
jgi:murein DD-endopeptidase MepM/ murein hydrolase activator NlpD